MFKQVLFAIATVCSQLAVATFDFAGDAAVIAHPHSGNYTTVATTQYRFSFETDMTNMTWINTVFQGMNTIDDPGQTWTDIKATQDACIEAFFGQGDGMMYLCFEQKIKHSEKGKNGTISFEVTRSNAVPWINRYATIENICSLTITDDGKTRTRNDDSGTNCAAVTIDLNEDLKLTETTFSLRAQYNATDLKEPSSDLGLMQDGMQHVNVKTDWKHDIDGGLDATNSGIVGLTMARAAAMDAAQVKDGALSFVS